MRWIVLLALPAPAFACPTGADMTAGVVLTLEDGTQEVYRRTAPDLVVVDVTFTDGFQSQNTLIHGTYVKRLADLNDGVVNLTDAWLTIYESPPPQPAPGIRGAIQTQAGTLGDFEAEVQSYTWGKADQMTIGDCRFEGITGVLTYKTEMSEVTETITYLRELGIGLLLSYAEPGFDTDVYTYTGIAAR